MKCSCFILNRNRLQIVRADSFKLRIFHMLSKDLHEMVTVFIRLSYVRLHLTDKNRADCVILKIILIIGGGTLDHPA